MPIDPIGEIPIIITGDDSDLKRALQDAQDAATKAGEKIAAAFADAGRGGISNLDELIQGLTDSEKKLADAQSAVKEQFQQSAQGASAFADSAEKAADATSHVAIEGEKLSPIAPKVKEISSAFDDLAKAAIGLVGLNVLKSVAIDALEFEANIQKATIALELFTGSAEGAQAILGDLKVLALQDALSFPSLVTAEQRLLEFGVTASAIPGALNAAADAAAATNRSFDQVANSMERMIESGVVNSRQLVQVGASAHDLAVVLGVADEEFKNAFKDLTTTERAQAFTEALAKLAGTAEKAASTIGGQWQNLKTEFAFTTNEMVSAIDPLIQKLELGARLFLAFTNSGVGSLLGFGGSSEPPTGKNLPGGANQVGSDIGSGEVLSLQEIVAINQGIRNAADGVKELAQAFAALKQEDFGLELRTMSEAFDRLTASGKLTDSQMVSAADVIESKLSAAFHAGAIDADTFNAKIAELEATIADAAAAVDAAAPKVYVLDDAFKQLFAQDPAGLVKVEQALGLITSEQAKLRLATIATNAELAKMAAFAENLYGTITNEQAIQKFAADGTANLGALQQRLQEGVLGTKSAYDQLNAAELEELSTAAESFKEHADYNKELLKAVHVQRQASVDDAIAANKEIQASDEFTAQIRLKSQQNTDKAILASMTEVSNAYIERLNFEIHVAEVTGADATKQIIDLEKVRIKMQELYDATHLLGDLYVKLYDDFGHAFDRLGKGIADNIIDGKNWHDVWQGIIKDIAKMFLEDIVGTAFKALKDSIEETTGLFSKMAGVITKGVGAAIHTLPGIPGGGANAFAGQGSDVLAVTKDANGNWVDATGTPVGASDSVGGSGGPTPSTGSTSGGGLSSLSSITSLASLGVSIASGITSGIQNSRMINLLGEIEISTRQTKEQLTGGIQTSLNTYLPELKHLTDIWGALVNGHLAEIKDILWWGVLNVNVANLGLGGGANPLGSSDFSWSQKQQNDSNAALNAGTSGTSDQNGINPVTARDPRANVAIGNPLAFHLPGATVLAPAATPGRPQPTFSGLDAGVPRMTEQDFLNWAQALQDAGTPGQFQKPDPTITTQALAQFSVIGKTAEEILAHLKSTAVGSVSSTGHPLTAAELADPNTQEQLRKMAENLASSVTQAALKANQKIADDYMKAFLASPAYQATLVPQNTTASLAAGYGHPVIGPTIGGSAGPMTGTFSVDQISSMTSQYGTYLQGVQSQRDQQSAASYSTIDLTNATNASSANAWLLSIANKLGDTRIQAYVDQAGGVNSPFIRWDQIQQMIQRDADVAFPGTNAGADIAEKYFNATKSPILAAYSQPVDTATMLNGYSTRISSAGMNYNTVGQRPGEGWNTYNVNVNALDLKATSVTNAIDRNLTAAGIKTK